jgi:hypothetical protein
MPWGFKEVEAPRFRDSRHMKVVRLSVLSTDCLYPPPPRKYSWYSYLLQAESTAGPQCGRKVYVNEIFRESNLQPPGLWRSASTNCATVCPILRAPTRRRQITMRFTDHFRIFGFQYVTYCVSRCRCLEFRDGSYIFRKFVDASVVRYLTWRFTLRISHSEFFEMPFMDGWMERNKAGPYLESL